MNRLKNILRKWLGCGEYERRLLDLERHFVTKRDDKGAVLQTLADVPVKDRKEFKPSLKGMSWEQRRRWLEETDGGRKIQPQQVSITAR